jgi:hypothetical protein
MDKDVNELINISLNDFFKECRLNDICLCGENNISEGNDYTDDGGLTWRHIKCKKLISSNNIVTELLRHSVEEAREIRKLARKNKGLMKEVDENPILPKVDGLPISGEKKYNKQEPGGQMAAVNIEENK